MNRNAIKSLLLSLCISLLCLSLAACNFPFGNSSTDPCQSNCASGGGVQGVRVYVEPDDGESVITGAIKSATKSVWLEIYILTDRNVIRALEEAANNGLDVRVMLEPHPVGSGSVSRTLDELQAAGVKAQYTSPAFALTHEKGMIVDSSTAYIMTSNFSRSALGGSSSSSTRNREYGIIDSNPQDVQSVISIFNADWNHTSAQFNDANLVVSPVNSRSAFMNIIGSAQHTLLIEAEEMNDSAIEQALVNASARGVQIEIILPAPSRSSGDSNSQGIAAINHTNITVREDPQLYMHAKIIVEDGVKAFVGSENISTQSLDQNRELGILVSDSTVLSKLQSTFQTDWAVSQGV